MKKYLLILSFIVFSISINGETIEKVSFFSKEQMEYVKKQINKLFIKENDTSELTKKIDMGLLEYTIYSKEETDEFYKVKFEVNGKTLYYELYKNSKAYKEATDSFMNDTFFSHLSEEKLKKGYRIIMLDPVISSPVYGKWYAIVGNYEIIKGSGDSFSSASENINEFFEKLEKLK